MCLTHVVCYSSNTPMHYSSAAQTQRQTNRRNQHDHIYRHNLAQRFGCRHGHNGSHRTQLSQTFQPLPPPILPALKTQKEYHHDHHRNHRLAQPLRRRFSFHGRRRACLKLKPSSTLSPPTLHNSPLQQTINPLLPELHTKDKNHDQPYCRRLAFRTRFWPPGHGSCRPQVIGPASSAPTPPTSSRCPT